MLRFISGFVIFFILSLPASALEFPFIIPPITEIPDLSVLGLYYSEENRIEVKDLNDKWVIAHEVGHHIIWGIPFPTCESQIAAKLNFPVKNSMEDAADSFAYFYFWKDKFRRFAESDSCLMKKYKIVYRVFNPRKV